MFYGLCPFWGLRRVNGCLYGPLNQMAITILHTNTRVFFSSPCN